MKKALITLLAISLILLSGISGCPQTSTTTQATSAGLDVQFSKDAPPVSVNVNQEFPVYVDVTNLGGDYVQKGDAKFYLSGIGPNLENVKSSLTNEKTFNKESTSPDRLTFSDNAKFTFPLQNLLVMPLALTSCYAYGTTTQANVCIASSNQSSVCSLGGEKITSDSNSIAPVQISSLTEEAVGNKLKIYLVISNKLGGQIYLQDSDCDKLLQAKDYSEAAKSNKVSIELRTPEKGLICKLQEPSSPYSSLDSLKGVADVGKVTCEKPLTSTADDHVSPLYIILRYKYVSSVTKNLNVLP